MSPPDADSDTAVDLHLDRVLDPVRERREQLSEVTDPLDTSRLKWVGIVTYFGVYALIALNDHFLYVRSLWLAIPSVVRPPPIPPLHELLGIYRSVAWGITSLSVAVVAVLGVATTHITRSNRDQPSSLDSLGTRSWTDIPARWGRTMAGIPASVRSRLPDGSSLKRKASALKRDDDRSASPAVTLTDGSLSPPTEPLSLPRTRGASQAPTEPETPGTPTIVTDAIPLDTGVLTIDDAVVRTDAEILDEDAERDDGTRSDGGSSVDAGPAAGDASPDPDAPWPDEVDDAADADEEASFDEAAPWPNDWIPGDEL